ncbi:MAG: efflux RND transporter periplasmic adaptor subunit [Syntrophomonadaceae bacterium]
MEFNFSKLGQALKQRKLSRRTKWIAAILIVAAGVGFFSWRSGNQPIPVEVTELKLQDIEKTVLANGRLEAAIRQEFFTPVNSTLMELNVKAGDRVKKDDVLGRLDSLELARQYKQAMAVLASREAELAKADAVSDELNLKEAEAEYNLAKNHLTRINQLYEAGAVSQEELESAQLQELKSRVRYNEVKIRLEQGAGGKQKASLEAQAELARQEMEQAKERLDMATFIAEFDGVVTSVNAQEGNRVMEGTPLLELCSEEVLEVTANINEIDAGSLEPGQAVRVNCLALPGKEYQGVVYKVGGAAVIQRSNSGELVNVPVTVKLEGETEELKIGYTVDLTINIPGEQNVLAIPVEAIVEKDNGKTVFVVKDGIAHEQQVETRMGNELLDIVISGLEPGDQVIVSPPVNLLPGQKVKDRSGADHDKDK